MFRNISLGFLLFAGFLCSTMLFFQGCGEEQKAVDLYVDAVVLNKHEQPEKAVKKLNEAVKKDDKFSLAYSLLGEIYQEEQQYDKSAEAYQKATEINPWSFRDYFNLGNVYQAMQKYDDAIKAYTRACDLDPYHCEAHLNAAKSYYEVRDYNQALVYGEQAEKIDANICEIPKLMGQIYDSQKKYDQAVAEYEKARKLEPNNPDLMIALGIAYLRVNHFDSAKEMLTQATQTKPDEGRAWQFLGYSNLQIYEKLANDRKAALAAEPNDQEKIASLEQQVKQTLNEAINSYQQAIKLNVNDWEAYRGIGVAYMIMGINDNDDVLKLKAVDHWKKSLALKPDQPRRQRLEKLIEKYSK